MLIFGFDTETTGLKTEKGDRIIEFYGEVYRAEDRRRMIALNQRINNQGKDIDKKAQEVHGIDAADLIGKPKWKEFGPKLIPIFNRRPILVAHNIQFDIGFLVHHMAEIGYEIPSDIILFDTMSEGMTASYDAKPPSLREFCWAMGIAYDPAQAHAADYDVGVMMQAFWVALDRGYFQLPEIIESEAA